jgi:hypothetical protein
MAREPSAAPWPRGGGRAKILQRINDLGRGKIDALLHFGDSRETASCLT